MKWLREIYYFLWVVLFIVMLATVLYTAKGIGYVVRAVRWGVNAVRKSKT